jgi:hypothetical protein
MTRFEKMQAWDVSNFVDFIVTIVKNTVEDATKEADDLNFSDVRWELIAQYYEDFLNEEAEE